MRTVTYKSVLDGLIRMVGEDPATLRAVDAGSHMEFLNQALSSCHEFWRWPELTRTEARYFRDAWTAQSYASGIEIYYAAGDAYYKSNATTAGGDVPGTSTKWDLLTDFNRYVSFTQTGQTPIEAVFEAWDADPRATSAARKLYFKIDADGVMFAPGAPNQVWIEFRVRCPDFTYGVVWSATSFASGYQVYDNTTTGELYRSNASVTGSDVPGTSNKWDKIDVPYIFRHAAKLKAYALWLEANERSDAAILYDNNDPANPGKFQHELEEQVWQFTKLQGQTGRPSLLASR